MLVYTDAIYSYSCVRTYHMSGTWLTGEAHGWNGCNRQDLKLAIRR